MAAKKKNKQKKHVDGSKAKYEKSEGLTKDNDTENDADISFNIVQALGGEKSDLALLADVGGDEDEVFDIKEDLDADPVSKDELRDLISQLGLEKYRPRKHKEEKPKKIKLASMPGTEEETGSSNEPVPSTSQTTEKKSKNKFKVQHAEVSSTTVDSASAPKFDFVATEGPRKHLLIKPGGKWSDHEFPDDPTTFEAISKEHVKKLQDFATSQLEADITLYRKQQDKKKSSDVTWMRTVLSSGTVSDKVAALTILIQESPVHTLNHLDTLITMVKKKGRREINMALDTLRELFLGDLLPERKLRSFEQHPFKELNSLCSGNKDSRNKRLVLWMFEHQLKDRYNSFIQALQTASHDTVAVTKRKAIDVTLALLAGKPEQEKVLLSMLVNKLGDPDHKVAAHTAHLLTQLVEAHPNMKLVIILEVERLLYRPNINVKAQYYAVCFLNQLVLSTKERNVGTRLIAIYFSFFKAFVKKKELDGKMLSGLLAGVNRAYPFAKVEKSVMEEQMATIYKLIPSISFNTSIQALLLLYHVIDTNDSMCDRYFMALYRKMLDPELQTSSKQAMFLNLLFKSMKKDNSTKRIQAFVKRLLQVCCQMTPTFTCGALVLLSELLKVRHDVLRITKVSEGSDDEEEHFEDQAYNSSEEEEEEKVEEERKSEEEVSEKTDADVKPADVSAGSSSWIHRRNTGDKRDTGQYDPHHRNPLHSKAETDCLWELERLTGHYHPSVALFAQTILKGEKIKYPGDPLQDFTLIRFLDRFVYRNPKRKEQLPSATQSVLRARQSYIPQGVRAIPVNTPEYLKTEVENIPADERFFHQFFSQKAAKAKEVVDADSDAESVSDSEFDDYLGTFEKGLLGEAKDDMQMDFASELRKVKGKKKKGGDASDEDDEDEDLDLSDEEIDFDDADFGDAFEDDADEDADGDEDGDADGDESDEAEDMDDEENVEDGDEFTDGFGDIDFMAPSKKKRKKGMDDEFAAFSPAAKKGKRGDDLSNIFAAAEEFAHLMDDNAGEKVDTTGTEAVANKDKASAKQLKWESDRDQWMRNQDWKSRKQGNQGPGRKGGQKWGAFKKGGGQNQGGKKFGGQFNKGKGKRKR